MEGMSKHASSSSETMSSVGETSSEAAEAGSHVDMLSCGFYFFT